MASHFRFLTWLGLCLTTLPAADLKLADVEFFESRIRPVLVAECYECHDAKKQKGDLRLDYRDGLLKGGEEGPAIVPGDAKKSLLLQSINHTHQDAASCPISSTSNKRKSKSVKPDSR